MKKYVIALATAVVLFSCQQEGNNSKEGQEETTVDSTAAKGKEWKVGIKEIKPEVFKHYFEIGGEVEALNSAFISAEMNGQIKKIFVKEGQHVKEGDFLVAINDNVLKSTLKEVKTSLDLARVVYEKQKELWNKKIGSEIQYLEAKTNKESLENKLETVRSQLEMTKIRAPFSGIVDAVLKKEGELAVPGYEIIRLVDLNKIKINADVAETYLSVVREGDPVTLSFPSIPNYETVSKISRIGNIINPANRSIAIEVNLSNKNGMIKPNALAILKINDYVNTKAFMVPSIIVKKDVSNNNFIFIAEMKGDMLVAKKITVTTGKSYEGNTEILSGLEKGHKVIIEGYNLVSNGARITIE